MALRPAEIWLFIAVWLGWNYTPLCWSQLHCHFLRSPWVNLPGAGWFIERFHCNSNMVEGPAAQITHGYYILRACPPKCNKRCYSTYEWFPSYGMFVFFIPLYRHHTPVQGLNWVWSNDQSMLLLHTTEVDATAHTTISFVVSPEANPSFIYTIKLRFPLICFKHISVQRPELHVLKQSSLSGCLLVSLCLFVCSQHGSVVDVDSMCLIRLLDGWR